jgi:hypothetical protein
VITKVVGPASAPDLVLSETTQVVKVEQADGDVTMTDSVTITTTTVSDQPLPTSAEKTAEEPAPNVLIPKKKKRQRSLSPEEELPPPPPPMRTLRLERSLVPDSPMIMWDILTEAQEKGMVPVLVKGLPVFVTDIEGGLESLGELPQKERAPALAISDLIGQAEPKLGESSKTKAPLTETEKELLEMEAIAKRLEEKYDKVSAVSVIPPLTRSLLPRSGKPKATTTTYVTSSSTIRSLQLTGRPTTKSPRKRASSSARVRSS